jgi:very-short-patch-repair endonuclease
VDNDFEIDCALGRHYDVQALKRWDERHLARLGAGQDGIVEIKQLSALGLTREARRRRIAQHRLVEMYRGVYAVGHGEVSERGRFRAAVLACGEGALLSHLAAARLLGLWERRVERLDVTVPSPRCPRVPGIRIHRATNAPATHVRGIPCTSVSRLLVDLAPTPMLAPVFERAERRRWVRPEVIEGMLHGRPGAAALRNLLETHRPQSGPTRSLLERRLLGALRNRGVPEPIVNGLLDLGGTIIEPDLMWPRERVLLELDGAETHATPTAMRRDRRRDRLAIRHGWTPLRATWHDDPAGVAADVAAALQPGSR